MDRALAPFSSQLESADRIVGCKLDVLEAVRGGTTTLGEFSGNVDDLIREVYQPLGVRVVPSETINQVDYEATPSGGAYVFDETNGEAALVRNEALFDTSAGCDLVTPMYGPQALDMVSPELLGEIRERARARNRRIHMHVAQGEREADQIRRRYGHTASSVGILDDLDLLSPRLLAAHCHGATPDERKQLAAAGSPSRRIRVPLLPSMGSFPQY